MEAFSPNLFVDVVNMSITASYVIVFVLVARLCLKKAPKIFSYSLWTVSYTHLLFDYRSEISDAIGNALGIDFTRKRLRLADIKNILANCKK